MKIGLLIDSFTPPGGIQAIAPRLVDLAQAADEAGLTDIWLMDHFIQISIIGKAEDPMPEAYSTLSFLAGKTQQVRLGVLVTGVIYRQPGILVKTVSTLDVLSGGRAIFGIGAAWNEVESRALGIPFPPVQERFQQLEETLQIALQMWSGKAAPFHGEQYSLEKTLNSPQPISQPHPPILIGGGGEKKTLRLVAQYGDACNFFTHLEDVELLHKLDVLKSYCEQLNRSYDRIEKTILDTTHFTKEDLMSDKLIEICHHFHELGFSHMIFSLPKVAGIDAIAEGFNKVIKEVRDLK
jgi:F420-dependent oxidoreductase-like protein